MNDLCVAHLRFVVDEMVYDGKGVVSLDVNSSKLPRTVTEEIENLTLSPYACKSTDSGI